MAERTIQLSELSWEKQVSYTPKSKFPPGYSYSFFLPTSSDRVAVVMYSPIDVKRNVFTLHPDCYPDSAAVYSDYVKVFGPQQQGIGLAAWKAAEHDFQYNHGTPNTRITVDQSNPFRWASRNLPHIWDSLRSEGYDIQVSWQGFSVGNPAWMWEAKI